jgi:hypothetical protein
VVCEVGFGLLTQFGACVRICRWFGDVNVNVILELKLKSKLRLKFVFDFEW